VDNSSRVGVQGLQSRPYRRAQTNFVLRPGAGLLYGNQEARTVLRRQWFDFDHRGAFHPNPMGRLYRNGLGVLLLALAQLIPFARAAGTPAAGDLNPEMPPGIMVDVGGYQLHLLCRGSGHGPSVIMDAGLGGFSMDWWFVQDDLAADSRVCTYDRAGYGWSDPGPGPRVTEQIADELEILLQAAHVPPPYVLVGHSFGGYNMEYFAATHPKQVAGLVLVDASHPDQAQRLPALPADTDRSGTLVTYFDPREMQAHFPEDTWVAMGALMGSSKAMTTQRREFANFAVSAAQVRMAGALPQVPLVVISRGRRVWPETPMGDALERAWADLQADLAASIPGGRQIRAERSGHLVHLDQPELVAGAVREVLQQACQLQVAGAPDPVRAGTC